MRRLTSTGVGTGLGVCTAASRQQAAEHTSARQQGRGGQPSTAVALSWSCQDACAVAELFCSVTGHAMVTTECERQQKPGKGQHHDRQGHHNPSNSDRHWALDATEQAGGVMGPASGALPGCTHRHRDLSLQGHSSKPAAKQQEQQEQRTVSGAHMCTTACLGSQQYGPARGCGCCMTAASELQSGA